MTWRVNGAITGSISGTSPIIVTGSVVSIQNATDSQAGAMTAADHTSLTELIADAGADYKLAVRAAAQANLAATRSGNVLTMTGNALLLKATIDAGWATGPALGVGQRVLIPVQTTQADSGWYDITDMGSVSTPAIFTRSSDANTSALVGSEAMTPVSEGTDAGKIYTLVVANPITLNTTALVFSKGQTGTVTVVGDGTTPVSYKGAANVDVAQFSSATNSGTRTGLATDYIVEWTETTTNNSIYQCIALSVPAGKRRPLIIKDVSYSGLFGQANTKTITLKPVSGKKLNNVVDATLVILNGGGVISVEIDDSDNLHQLGFTA